MSMHCNGEKNVDNFNFFVEKLAKVTRNQTLYQDILAKGHFLNYTS
jgi:hypothetical protein